MTSWIIFSGKPQAEEELEGEVEQVAEEDLTLGTRRERAAVHRENLPFRCSSRATGFSEWSIISNEQEESGYSGPTSKDVVGFFESLSNFGSFEHAAEISLCTCSSPKVLSVVSVTTHLKM